MNLDETAHYSWHPSGIRQFEVAELCGYHIGSAIKYCWRANHKRQFDSDKAKLVWHIKREIELRKSRRDAWAQNSVRWSALAAMQKRLMEFGRDDQTLCLYWLIEAELHPLREVDLNQALTHALDMLPIGVANG